MEWKKDPNGGETLNGMLNGFKTLLGGYAYNHAHRAWLAYIRDCEGELVTGNFAFKEIPAAKAWVEANAGKEIVWSLERDVTEQKKVYLGEKNVVREGRDTEKWGNMARDEGAMSVSQYAMRTVKTCTYVAFLNGLKAYKTEEHIIV